MKKELAVRKRLRLQGYNYSSSGYYFLTVCVDGGHELLGGIVGDAVLCVPRVELSDIGKTVQIYLEKMNTVLEYAFLEKYVIMPNHVHLLVAVKSGTQRTASPTKAVIPRIVHGMKAVTTKQTGYSIWQRGCNDRIIRNQDEYQRISRYIEENPAKWAEDRYYK